MKNKIIVVGAGGQARETRWLIEEIDSHQHSFKFLGYVVSDLNQLSERDSKDEILGDIDWLEDNLKEFDSLAIGIGNPKVRKKIGIELKKRFPDIGWPTLIHPSVQFDRKSWEIGKGVLLCAGNIGTVNVSIYDFAMVNLSCTIGHEARIGSGSVLNSTVNISGGVFLEDEVLVGTGAQILQYVHVGQGAVVGAGAVVNRDVDRDITVVGIPAKPLKTPSLMK